MTAKVKTDPKNNILSLIPLYYKPPFGIIFPEFAGSTLLLLPKCTIEIGEIVKPALIGDFGDWLRRAVEHGTNGPAKAYIVQTVDKVFARMEFDRFADERSVHIDYMGKVFKFDRAPVMFIQVFHDSGNPLWVEILQSICKRRTG